MPVSKEIRTARRLRQLHFAYILIRHTGSRHEKSQTHKHNRVDRIEIHNYYSIQRARFK